MFLGLTPRAKDQWLRRAIDNPDLALGGEMLRAFRAERKCAPVSGRRTVAELGFAAEKHRGPLAKRVDKTWTELGHPARHA